MAIRELVTQFSFQNDLSGLNDYNRALEKTKVATEKAFDLSKLNAGLEKLSSATFKLTNMMGLTFATTALDQIGGKLFDYIKEIANGAKEANRLNAQIALIVGNTKQAQTVQESLFNLAQKTGMEYTDILEMSKGLLVAGKEQSIPVEKTTDAISNMVLALKVGKSSAQETAEAVGSLEQAMRMGKIGPRSIGRLIQAPGLGQFLADQITGGDLGKLRAKVKAGFNIKDLIESLAKPNADLNAKAAKLPFTIARAFTMIKNDVEKAYGAIMKLSAGFGGIGKIVWSVFSFAKGAVLGFVDTLGGLKNTIELVGIALAVALGPLLIRNIILATASLVEMAIASWAVWLPWLAIGVAIAAVAIGIQDFLMWMRNPNAKTIFGDMLGPFDEFKKKIQDFPIVKMFEGLTTFLSGDFGKGFTQIITGFNSIEDPAAKVATIVTVIGGAFLAWEALSFVGIIGALGTLAKAFIPVSEAAAKTTAAIETTAAVAGAAGAGAGAGAGAKGGAGAPAVVPGAGPRATPKRSPFSGGKLNTALQLGLFGFSMSENMGITKSGVDLERLNDAALGSSLGMFLGLPGTIAGAVGGALWKKPDFLPEWMNKGLGDFVPDSYRQNTIDSQETIPTLSNDPIVKRDLSKDVSDLFGWLRDAITSSQDAIPTMRQPVTKEDLPPPGTQAPAPFSTSPATPLPWGTNNVVPQVMPFDNAMTVKSIDNTVNAGGIIQNNTITVTAQMNEDQVAQAVKAQVASQAPDLLDKVSRQISDAIPRTERATQ